MERTNENLFSYLRWRGDLSFAADPLNEVDALAFAVFSYLDYSAVSDGLDLKSAAAVVKKTMVSPRTSLVGRLEALEQAAQGADLLLCDATYALPEQQEQAAQWGHSTFGQSAALAARAGAHRLWLTHYSPMITDPEADLPQAQSIFPAAVCGADGMQITLQYEEAQP